MKWLPIIFILMALLLFGCVEERQVSITGYEQIETITTTDLTGEGVNSIQTYRYSPKSINDELGIYMRKIVTTYPISLDVSVVNYSEVTPTDLQQIKTLVNEFETTKNVGESACFAKLGLNKNACVDDDSCLQSCTGSTCTSAAAYNTESLGHELYLFNYNSQELDHLIAEVEATNSATTQEQKDLLAGKLSTMLVLSAKLQTNLLFNSDALRACNQPTYDTEKIMEALDIVGEVDLDTYSYEYQVLIVVDGGSSQEHIELYITDSPPLTITPDPFSIDFLGNGKLYEKDPLIVGWDGVELDGAHRFVYYDFASQTEPTEEVMTKWKFPKVKERNITALSYLNQIYENPILNFIFTISATVFAMFSFLGFYAAVGAAVSVWVIALFVLILILEIIYYVIRATMEKKNVKEVLMDGFGAPIADWKIYVGVGLALIIASIVLNITYTTPVDSNAFDIETLVLNLGSDVVGAVCVLLFVIGVYTLFLVAEDLFKGLIIGKDYYELKGATKEENLKGLSELREKWQALRMRVEDLSKTGMVVTEEYAIIVSVPIERLEQMIASGKQGMAKQLIKFNLERLDGLDKKLDEKVNVMNEKWPEWRGELAQTLEGSDSIPLNTLLFIPLQWREWAVEKYISENRTKGFVLEGDTIVKREVKIDEILTRKLKSLLKKKTVKQAVLISQDIEIFNSFNKGKKIVVDVLFLKLKAYVRALSKKMGANEVKRFVISGEKNAGVYVSHDNYEAFIVSEKSKIKEVVEDWNKMVDNLS